MGDRHRPAMPSDGEHGWVLDAWLDLVTGSACVGCARPGRLLCPGCAGGLPASGRPAAPDPCPEGLAEVSVGGSYGDLLRAMVIAHKERRAFALARPLADVLAVATRDLVGRPSLTGSRLLLVPVPSRPAVVSARGHDPMLRVARGTARRLRADGHDVRVVGLLRQADRPADQSGLDAAGRHDNLAETMAARTPALRALARSGRRVAAVICDDVLTTGATAREAQRALQAVGVPVVGIACVAATVKRVPSVRGGTNRASAEVDPHPATY